MSAKLRPRHWACLGGGVTAVIVLGITCIYIVWMGYLAVFASEGAIPPSWRLPDLQSGAQVVSEDASQCASGGCWKEIRVQPAPGQSPSDLAADMDLREPQRLPWHPLDPHSVAIESRPDEDVLVVHLQY